MKILYSLALTLVSAMAANAQVANYALELEPKGHVDCGTMPEMEGLSSYTVQFWINPASWTEGASLISLGDQFAAQLGKTGEILFKSGGTSLSASSAALVPGNWVQYTLVCDNGRATAMINGAEAASGQLAAIPADAGEFTIGGGYSGRIDEIRLWKAVLADRYDRFIFNTINRWNPQWDDLHVYYKMDQDGCANLVDYKVIEAAEAPEFNNHGIMSASGVRRVSAADNTAMPYLINSAYTENSRFYDRAIPREQYLLSNDLIILGIQSMNDGHLKPTTPNNHATVTNGTWLAESAGRTGVIQLGGDGSVNCGKGAFARSGSNDYTFEAWIYLDEWTEGGYIFRKETADGQHGLSIRLGDAETSQIIVRCDGKEYVNVPRNDNRLKVGQWTYFALIPGLGTAGRNTFMWFYDTTGVSGTSSLSATEVDNTPEGMDDCDAIIGEGMKARFDDVLMMDMTLSSDQVIAHRSSVWMPGFDTVLTAAVMAKANAFYRFDEADRPGWSYHSQDEWRRIMESAYEGHRGYQVRISVKSHDGWQTTIADASRRKIFAADLARLSADYDGVELDLEWMYGTQTNLGLLAKEIRAALPEGKTFFISCHNVAYAFPTDMMQYVDGFTFQQYGPSNVHSHYSHFEKMTKAFIDYGFPKEKIMCSYATTTSKGYINGTATADIKGVRNGFLDDGYVPNSEVDTKTIDGYTYYFDGPVQTYNRARYCMANNLQGIFYWDMGNDVPVSHQYNLAKNCSYAMNANVDRHITEVTVRHRTQSGIETAAVTGRGFNVYPSPADNELFISMPEADDAEVRMFGPGGSLMLSASVASDTAIDVSNLAGGVYVITARGHNGGTYSSKFIKK